jgi:hypothetical protein
MKEHTTEVKKLYLALKQCIPEEVHTAADKKARKRKISSLLRKIHVCPESKWDLSEQLKAALKLEESDTPKGVNPL